jgi:parallel beta helix pectate lyase-like protein
MKKAAVILALVFASVPAFGQDVEALYVSNTHDAGPGSLRQALLDAAHTCVYRDCTISFEIAETPPGGVHIIEPLTPLPPVTGRLEIDGASQRQFHGDTRLDGPEIVLRGARVSEGPGLLLGAGTIFINELEIREFPGAGVELRHDETCYGSPVGSHFITDSVLAANEYGVALTKGCAIGVDHSVIVDNRRDGIFIAEGSGSNFDSNRIERNGGSGIDMQLTVAVDRFTSAFIEDNVVAHNGKWGIAYAEVGKIALRRNATFGNGLPSLDAGRDLTTRSRANDVTGVPNAPILMSVTYDAATHETIIHGRLASARCDGNVFDVELFASNSADREAEEYVVTYTQLEALGEFTMRVNRDLRGKWITATTVRSFYSYIPFYSSYSVESSELSNAVYVTTKKGRAVRTAP